MNFYIGLHQPANAKYFSRCMISVNRLIRRKSNFIVNEWIMDSGAFSQIYHLGQHMDVADYAELVKRWAKCGKMVAAVAQDFMCEPFILDRTGATTAEHQKWTIERYVTLRALVPPEIYIMPVLQGYKPEEYVRHVKMYGDLLTEGAWVGVGTLCKRNSSPWQVMEVLYAIKRTRPDLKLHGFGLKLTALTNESIRNMLYSADSMAWSFAARKGGRNPNDYKEARIFLERIENSINTAYQMSIYDLFGSRRDKIAYLAL